MSDSDSTAIKYADTAYMLFATTLVMLQTPGMGLTQAGLIREKNALSMLAQTFLGMTIGALLWIVCGFGLTFGKSVGDWGLIGDPFEYPFFVGVSISNPYSSHTASTIPMVLFASFQMMFALMTPLIISGSWIERMNFQSIIIFLMVWPFLVYYPLAHWSWHPHGWLSKLGFEDFAGGIVIHASAGVSGLVVSMMLRKRFQRHEENIYNAPVGYHNLPLAIIGATLTWAGWYSFNGGSAYAANEISALALFNTHISACVGSLVHIVWGYKEDGMFHLLALMNGCLSGLASITPAGGFVPPYFAPVVGFCGSMASYFGGKLLKERYRVDDVLDVFALQAIPGATGTILVGFLANADMTNSKGHGLVFGFHPKAWRFLGVQLLGTVVGILWSAVWTFILFRTMRRFVEIDIDAETELEGLDRKQIGEKSYRFSETSRHHVLTFELCHACKIGDFREVLRIMSTENFQSVNRLDHDGRSALHISCCYNHIDVADLLLKCGAQVDITDRWGNYPIDETVNPDIKQLLLEYNSPPPNKNHGLYRFLGASSEGNISILQHIITNNFDINSANYDGRTALHLAVCNQHAHVVKFLKSMHASMDMKDRWGNTPAACARFYWGPTMIQSYRLSDSAQLAGAKEIYELLVGELFEDDEFSREDSQSIISKDSFQSKISEGYELLKSRTLQVPIVVKSRLDNGFAGKNELLSDSDNDSNDPKEEDQKDFSISNKGKNAENSNYKPPLSPYNTSVNGSVRNRLRRDNSAKSLRTPLLLSRESEKAIKLATNGKLIRTSLPTNLRSSNTKEAIDRREEDHIKLHRFDADIFQFVKDCNIRELKLLFRKGQDLNIIDYDHRNLLHIACCKKNLKLVQWLVEHGVNVNVKDSQLQTPLYEAKRVGDPDIIQYLKSQGALEINILVGSKLCELGSKGDITGLVMLVRDGNEDLSIGDVDFRTALHLAACEGHYNCVDWLVKNGANVHAKDRFNNTPLDDAKRYGHERICQLLEKY